MTPAMENGGKSNRREYLNRVGWVWGGGACLGGRSRGEQGGRGGGGVGGGGILKKIHGKEPVTQELVSHKVSSKTREGEKRGRNVGST